MRLEVGLDHLVTGALLPLSSTGPIILQPASPTSATSLLCPQGIYILDARINLWSVFGVGVDDSS